MRASFLLALAAAAAAATQAGAQETGDPAGNPAPAEYAAADASASSSSANPSSGAAAPAPGGGSQSPPSPICTDRPTKSDVPCVVPVGVFQIETDLGNAAFFRRDGVTTDTYLAPNPTFKLGVSPGLDVEAAFAPFEEVRTHSRVGTQVLDGVGDLYLRVKYAALGTDQSDFQLSLDPYLKAPTARIGIGDGAVEGGLVAPMSLKLSDVLTLTASPEADVLKNALDDGRHLNVSQTLNLSFALPAGVTLFGELWGNWNFDPQGEVSQSSLDFAAAKLVGPDLQLDAGLDLGLNRQTPGVQLYAGVSKKW